MKKVLVGLGVFFACVMVAEAFLSSIRINTLSNDSVVSGETITITIKATKGMNIKLSAVQGIIEYDKNDFKLISVNPIRDNWRALHGDFTDIGFTVIADDTGRDDYISSSGEIFNVVLEANAINETKKSLVRYSEVMCWNQDEGDPNPCNSSSTEITILPAKSSVKSLKALSVSGYPLTPAFNSVITNYSVTVPSNIDKVVVSAETTDHKASFKVLGHNDLDYGQNKIDVIVTAENGDTRTYVVMVTRLESSDTNGLSSLIINNGTLDPEFSDDIYSYFVDVFEHVTELDIIATPINNDANVTIKNNDFMMGDEPVVEVIVLSESGQTITYYLNVNFIEASDNARLAKLEIDGIDFEFSPEQKEYKIATSKDLNDLVLLIETEDENASYEVIIKDDRIEIVVTSSSDETETYQIINEKPFSMWLYVVIAISSVVVIVGTIYGVKKFKMRKKDINKNPL